MSANTVFDLVATMVIGFTAVSLYYRWRHRHRHTWVVVARRDLSVNAESRMMVCLSSVCDAVKHHTLTYKYPREVIFDPNEQNARDVLEWMTEEPHRQHWLGDTYVEAAKRVLHNGKHTCGNPVLVDDIHQGYCMMHISHRGLAPCGLMAESSSEGHHWDQRRSQRVQKKPYSAVTGTPPSTLIKEMMEELNALGGDPLTDDEGAPTPEPPKVDLGAASVQAFVQSRKECRCGHIRKHHTQGCRTPRCPCLAFRDKQEDAEA